MLKKIHKLLDACITYLELQTAHINFLFERNKEMYEQSKEEGQRIAEAIASGRLLQMPQNRGGNQTEH